MFKIRKLANKMDFDFLTDMLYESIYISSNKPSKQVLLQTQPLRKYHRDWGRAGDIALIADNQDQEPVGAVWYRVFGEQEKGYGFVSSEIPELGIAIKSAERGKGLGKQLMQAILQEANEAEYPGLSLSVDLDNHGAITLYHKLGFKDVEIVGTSKTMIYLFK